MDPILPDVLAAIFVPAVIAFLGALFFRSTREAIAARLRGHSNDEVDLALLDEVRALRGEVYALRTEVAAVARPPANPALPPAANTPPGAQQIPPR
jgi:hypothetical protein